MSIERIIRLFAGIVILTSLGLAYKVHPNWLWVTAFVGFNLAQSSITGALLHGFIGYEERPAGMQIVVYLIVLLSIALGMRYINRMQCQSHDARTRN